MLVGYFIANFNMATAQCLKTQTDFIPRSSYEALFSLQLLYV